MLRARALLTALAPLLTALAPLLTALAPLLADRVPHDRLAGEIAAVRGPW